MLFFQNYSCCQSNLVTGNIEHENSCSSVFNADFEQAFSQMVTTLFGT